jgi:arsenate reductase-like glutaredoxin family protein
MFGKTEHKVTIYTTPTCSVCRRVKEYLAHNRIDYEEINVASDRSALTKRYKSLVRWVSLSLTRMG